MLNTAVLLIPASIGAACTLRTGSFNLGGEAQLYAPALITALILSRAPDTVSAIPFFLAALCAALTVGAILAAIPGLLRIRFHASELLTSFLLSAALLPLLDYLVAGPLRDPGKNLLATSTIPESVRIPPLVSPSFFNGSAVPVLLLAVLWALILVRTRTGYRMSMTGTAPEFAAFTGISTKRITVLGMVFQVFLP
jgi:simple sugar transport system permease protein